jgi:succinate-acetate transporter protein
MAIQQPSYLQSSGQEPHVRAHVALQPIAAPSILGLYGFAGATFMVAANLAGWYGDVRTPHFLFPFAAMFGGLAQFLAGMWAVKARDGLASAMHGTWGAFWLAYGVLELLFATRLVAEPTGAFPALAFWFVILAAVTWAGAAASLATNAGLVSVLTILASGSTLMAIATFLGNPTLRTISGYVFMASAVAAWYTATALMIEETFDRAILPLGKTAHAQHRARVAIGLGEPGVVHGQ